MRSGVAPRPGERGGAPARARAARGASRVPPRRARRGSRRRSPAARRQASARSGARRGWPGGPDGAASPGPPRRSTPRRRRRPAARGQGRRLPDDGRAPPSAASRASCRGGGRRRRRPGRRRPARGGTRWCRQVIVLERGGDAGLGELRAGRGVGRHHGTLPCGGGAVERDRPARGGELLDELFEAPGHEVRSQVVDPEVGDDVDVPLGGPLGPGVRGEHPRHLGDRGHAAGRRAGGRAAVGQGGDAPLAVDAHGLGRAGDPTSRYRVEQGRLVPGAVAVGLEPPRFAAAPLDAQHGGPRSHPRLRPAGATLARPVVDPGEGAGLPGGVGAPAGRRAHDAMVAQVRTARQA